MKHPPSFKILETCAMKENKNILLLDQHNTDKIHFHPLRANLSYLYKNAKTQNQGTLEYSLQNCGFHPWYGISFNYMYSVGMKIIFMGHNHQQKYQKK